MPQRQLFLAAYDVRDDSRLRRALHVLKDYTCGMATPPIDVGFLYIG